MKRHFKLLMPGILFLLISGLAIIPISCKKDSQGVDVQQNTREDLTKQNNLPGPPQLLVSGLQGGSGSTIGPGGDLFVAENLAGRISRIDKKTGSVTTFATGLPPEIVGIGGVMDVAFIGDNAYALVTLVDDPLFPTGAVNGIYRIDAPDHFTVVADIGAYNLAHPPTGFPFFVATGVLYAFEPYHNGFLVTDGHFNRVLYVTLDGSITQLKNFTDIVPTGLAVHGNTIYLSQAGPIPHLPENGKIVSFDENSSGVTTVASGAPLLVDVERGRGQTLFGLAQGHWEGGPGEEGTPAQPNTGSLVRVNDNGTFTQIASGLDRPTSMEIVNNKAYIITLDGEIWTVDNIAGSPFGN